MAGFKARGGKERNNNSSFDWAALNAQVDEGSHGARIVSIIDLGFHQDATRLGDKGYTAFETMEDAEQFIEDMVEKYGEKNKAFEGGLPEVEDADDSDYDPEKTKVVKKVGKGDKAKWVADEDGDANYVVNINEYGGYDKDGKPKLYQEIAIFADCTEMEVDYGEEIGVKPYRVMLNRSFMGDITGFQLKKVPPNEKGGVWTIKGNTKLAEIATATGHKDLLSVDLDDADWSEMLGEGFNLQLTRSGDKDQYINVGKCVSLKKKKNKATGKMEVEEVEELTDEAVAITFDNATVEMLEIAKPRFDVIKKIKSATDYEGSAMQDAVEAYEELMKAKYKAKSKDSEYDESEDEDEEETPKSKTKPKAKTKPKKVEEEPEDDDSEDEDNDDSEEEEEPQRKVTKVTKAKTKPKKVDEEPEDDDSEDEDDSDWDD